MLRFIAASLCLHLLITLGFWVVKEVRNKPKEAVDLAIVELSKEEVSRIKKQIVETNKIEKSNDAAKDAYLSEQTQTALRETKVAKTGAFKEGMAGSTHASQKSEASKQTPSLKLGDLGVKVNFKPIAKQDPQKAGQEASSSDHLNNVKEGAQTLLNTKEFQYFSFYQRVRKQLEQFWEPNLRQKLKKMFDRGRSLASEKEHATKLVVFLDNEGVIRKVKVLGTSGVFDLDQAAIEAFNRAGPFPNPPKGMIEANGTVSIEWEFILKT